MARSATARLVLDGSEHDGTLAVVGMTTFEGEPACGGRTSFTSLYAVGQRPGP